MKHEPMSQERLEAIASRAEAAERGPWEVANVGDNETSTFIDGPDGDVLIRSTRGNPYLSEEYVWVKDPNAQFIAHAREDIPALLAEVERLKRFESIVSWRYGDTTDGKTREDMVERAKRAFGAATAQVSSIPLGMSEAMFIDSVGLQHQHAIRAALDAALSQ